MWTLLLTTARASKLDWIRAKVKYEQRLIYKTFRSEEVLGLALRRVPRHAYYIGTKVRGQEETSTQSMRILTAR